jgi:CDP-diacylglycerol--glycerol-3-phosphate 3-phosphatidyltransferase
VTPTPALGAASETRTLRFGPGAVATPANFVTIARLLLAVPTLILIERRGASWLAITLWFVLACTDGVDGWLARRDGTTRSGAFLDPLADKFLVLGGFVALALRGSVPWAPVVLIGVREIGISIYRTLASRRGISLPALFFGKVKAVVQLLAVGVVITPFFSDVDWLTNVMVWGAVVVTILSGIQILRHGWKEHQSAS